MGGLPLGAVPDIHVDATEFAKSWGLPAGGAYLNAGILLIDLDMVRKDRLFEEALAFLAEHGASLPYNDQDALNRVFWMRWKMISTRWNVQRGMVIVEKDFTLPETHGLNGQSPAIVHYTGDQKPWMAGAWHPWAWLYWRSLARTPFFKDVVRSQRVSRLERLRTWLRWLKRRP